MTRSIREIQIRKRGARLGPKSLIFIIAALLLVLYFFAPNLPAITLRYFGVGIWQSGEVVRNSLVSAEETRMAFFGSRAGLLELLRDERSLTAELAAKNANLEAELARMENASEFIALSGFGEEEVITTAAVVSKPPFSPYDTLIVLSDGEARMSHGDLVVVGGSVIGEVTDASGRTAKVKLYSYPDLQKEILIGEEKIAAVSFGRGGGNFVARVPSHLSVNADDEIYLSSHPTSVFAKVGKVEADSRQTFKVVFFSSPVNFTQLGRVAIVKDDAIIPLSYSDDAATTTENNQ